MLFSLLNLLLSVFPFHYNKNPGKNEEKCRIAAHRLWFVGRGRERKPDQLKAGRWFEGCHESEIVSRVFKTCCSGCRHRLKYVEQQFLRFSLGFRFTLKTRAALILLSAWTDLEKIKVILPQRISAAQQNPARLISYKRGNNSPWENDEPLSAKWKERLWDAWRSLSK